MCLIISTAPANRSCTSLTPASKFSIGVAKIFISSKATPKVLRLVLESKLNVLVFKLSDIFNVHFYYSGKFGLWLDGDLNQGRSQSCSTYSNEPLAPEEDFVIKTLECWAFV